MAILVMGICAGGLFGGCVTVDTTVSPTGKIFRRYTILTRSVHQRTVEAEMEAYLGRAWTGRAWTGRRRLRVHHPAADRVEIVCQRKLRDCREIPHVRGTFSRTNTGPFSSTLIYAEHLDLGAVLPTTDEQQIAAKIPVVYRIHMPGPITQASEGAKVAGHTAEWSFLLAEADGRDLQVTAEVRHQTKWWLVVIMGAILLGLVLYALGPVFKWAFTQFTGRGLTPEERERRRQEQEEKQRQRQAAAEERQRQQAAAQEEKARKKAEAQAEKERLKAERAAAKAAQAEEKRRQKEAKQAAREKKEPAPEEAQEPPPAQAEDQPGRE